MKRVLTVFLFLFWMSSQSFAQERTVTGKVSSKEDGTTLPGVNVILKGTSTGTTTDADGTYKLSVPAAGGSLIFSFIGLQTSEIAIGDRSTIDIELSLDVTQLSEIVVTGFSIERDKKQLGYGSSEVKAQELTTAKVSNLTNALGGKVAGVMVSGSGGAFTSSNVIIRGFTTFTGSNQPLYVIDGVPIDNSGGGTPLQSGPSVSSRAIDINPEDIESMSVLKGAAATVTYGSRAASGVILITTKKAKRDTKNSISYSSSYNIAQVNRLPDYQNEYAQGSNGTFLPGNINTVTALGPGGGTGNSSSWGPRILGQEVVNFFGETERLQAHPDNVKDIFQQGYNLQNNLSFSGSTAKSIYRISYGNSTETYVLDNNKLKRNNISVNVSTDVTSKLTVGTSFTYTNNTSIRTQQGNQLGSPLFRAYFTPRSYDLKNKPFESNKGVQYWYGGEDHPYWSIKHIKYNDEINRTFGNVNLRYEFADWLSADLKVGTDFYSLISRGFDERGTRGGGNTGASQSNGGGIINRSNYLRNTNSYFTLTANKKLGDINLIGVAGNEVYENFQYNSSVTGFGLVVPGFDNIKNTTSSLPSYSSTKTRLAGVFIDAIVDYKGFLSLNLKARNDWSSTLSKENRSILYSAAAVSFLVTDAFPSLRSKTLNQLKVRANIGEVGKGAPAYSTDSYFNVPAPSDGFTTGIRFPYNSLPAYSYGNTAGNPNLTPEFTREVEFGLEFGLFDNRLTFDGSAYQKKTRNVILSAPFSPASGISAITTNAGKLTTTGIEFQITGVPVRKKNLQWEIGMNFTQFKSVVDELAPGVSVIFLGGFNDPNVRLVAGDQYGLLYGVDYKRNAQGQLLLNADGLPIAENELSVIGNPNPDFLMGITNSINYKGINFNFLIDIRQGGDQYSRNIADVRRNGVAKETAEYPRFLEDNVTPNRPYIFEGVYDTDTPNAGQPNTTYITAQQYWGNSGVFLVGKGYIFDTSWIRLREASITYNLPKSILEGTPFGNVEVGVFGRNLFLHAPNYPHFDPEQNALGVNNAQGLEFNSLPNTRTLGANLRVTF